MCKFSTKDAMYKDAINFICDTIKQITKKEMNKKTNKLPNWVNSAVSFAVGVDAV